MTLVEKMARAIDAAEVAWCSQHQDKSVADMPDTLKALAALKAMREPSDVMESAGCNVVIGFSGEYSDYNEYLHETKLEEVWQAMIDAAIKEAGSGL